MNRNHKKLARRLLASALCIFLLIGTVALVYTPLGATILMALLGGPLNDDQLINQQFNTRLPVFSDIEVLKREGSPTGSERPRKLMLQVTIDGYPHPLRCQGELLYLHGDPSFVSVTWSTEECKQQDRLVRVAQYLLEDNYPEGPLPTNDLPLAPLLKRWIEQHRITLNDVKQTDMRDMIRRLPEGQ